ncbi:MAG: hypothetical protein ACSLE3_04950 [Microbacteriaceae bacterium]
MTIFTTTDQGLILVADHREAEYRERSLRRSANRTTVRLRPGVYVEREQWQRAAPIERHRLRVLAASVKVRPDTVFSHHAAAAIHGIPTLGAWPTAIDILTARGPSGRSDGLIARHALGIDDARVERRDGVLVTTPAQTVVHLALAEDFQSAVCRVDRVLWRKDPLCAREDLEDALALLHGRRGYRKAVAAVDFGTSLADSVLESASRVQLHWLGYPPPILQQAFPLSGGRQVRTDFWWPTHRVIGEADGAEKYLNPDLRKGRTADQVVLQEKRREDELRAMVRGFVRWGMPEALDGRLLAARFLPVGLPRRSRRA